MMEPTEYDKYVEPDEASIAEWKGKLALKRLAHEQVTANRRALMLELNSKLKSKVC